MKTSTDDSDQEDEKKPSSLSSSDTRHAPPADSSGTGAANIEEADQQKKSSISWEATIASLSAPTTTAAVKNIDEVADFKARKGDSRPSKRTDDGDLQPDIQQRHDETASQRGNVSMAPPSLPVRQGTVEQINAQQSTDTRDVVSTPRIFSGEYLPNHGAYAVAGPDEPSNADGRASPVTNPSYNEPAEQEEEVLQEQQQEQGFVVVGTATAVEPDDRTQRFQELYQEVEELRARNRELEDVQGVAVVIASEEGEIHDATSDNGEEPHAQETPVQEEAGKGSRQLDNEDITNRAHRLIGRNRRLCVIMTILLIGAVVGISVGVSSPQNKGDGEPSSVPTISTPRPTPQPTRSPTPRPSLRPTPIPTTPSSDPTTALIQANALDGGTSLNDPSSPQSQALQWLLGNSELSTYSDRRKLQRYSLATLYYSTNGAWWTRSTGWLTDSHECTWTNGVTLCSDGEFVSHLDMSSGSGNNLVGTLPRELALLSTSIVRMELEHDSKLSGTIPSEIGLLTSLQILWMCCNALSSTIPSELGLLDKMEGLSLHNNKLTGTIPSEVNEMKNLDELHLHNNNLSPPFTCPSFVGWCPISCDIGTSSTCREL